MQPAQSTLWSARKLAFFTDWFEDKLIESKET
jgi:hypothetical protein